MSLSSKVLYDHFVRKLETKWELDESKKIAEIVFDQLFGFSRIDIFLNKSISQPDERLTPILQRLLNGEPVQYVLNHAAFFGLSFFVNSDVLIPRQETEELVALILKENDHRSKNILDIGTGSGIIALALHTHRPKWKVSAWDLSPEALEIAERNAHQLKLTVDFACLDILNKDPDADQYHVIISNPPYIPRSEKSMMAAHVIAYEPDLALFVEDHHPLIFYDAIAKYALKSLKKKGKLYFEIHEDFADKIKTLLNHLGFEGVVIHHDLNKKARMASAIRA
jgi:release factor glutamine methyltransferase